MDNSAVGRAVFWLARSIAIAGGLVLSVVVAIVVVSVVGRALIPLGLSAVPGDFEIVQFGVLFAIFSALPLTQYLRGHADVSVLVDHFPVRAIVVIEFVMDVLMLGATCFILWRFAAGMIDKYANREMTFILHVPLWWTYAAGMVGAVTMLIVSAYCVVRSFLNATSRNPEKPEPGLF